MSACVAYGCTNRAGNKKPGITFHRFPKNEERRQLWIKAIRRQNWVPTVYSRICSKHFTEDMIDRTSLQCVRIRENAVPTVFESFPPYLKQDNRMRKMPFSRENEERDLDAGVSNHNGSNSPNKLQYKRKVEELSEIIEVKNKKIRVLQQKTRRYNKRISNLNALIDDLRKNKFMTDDALDVLNTVSSVNEEFLSRQLSSVSDKPLPTKYSPELRTFALTLHFYSPRAYEYVRKTFNLALPHQRTLSSWYQYINGSPGFTKESFMALDAKIKSSYPLYFTLLMDEMAIRQIVEYDGENYHGFINMGTEENDDALPLAKEAFVLLLVCINDNWKLPLGYFLTNGLSSNQKANLVKQCLIELANIKANVVALTFDGLSSNMTMMKECGCSIDPKELNTTFEHPAVPDSKIAMFLDPVHMLKLVRNTFGDKKTLFHNGKMINWKYITCLNELQEKEGLHLGNKLRTSHINFHKQKMKVKLASQLFSKSVADAIEYCDKKLKLSEFKNSEATVQFIRIFNDLFDVLNSRSLKQYGFKKALCKSNFVKVKALLEVSDSYISSLQQSRDGASILYSNRKTGFLGFKICIQSYLYLAEKLITPDNPALSCLSGYKISQDHLELFFASIRYHGGCNNNPSARQFKAAYKKMLVKLELQPSKTGNCIPLSEISILSVPSFHSSQDVINFTSYNDVSNKEEYFNESCQVSVQEEEKYLIDFNILNDFSKDIVYYISGFVVKKLLTSLKCPTCVSVLKAPMPPVRLTLICFKSEGGLIYPSNDVYDVCKMSEAVFRRYFYSDTEKLSIKKIAALKNEILASVNLKNIFQNLKQHQFDNDPLDNHCIHLIKTIIHNYLNVRIHYHCKNFLNKNQSIRQLYTKTILFKGQ